MRKLDLLNRLKPLGRFLPRILGVLVLVAVILWMSYGFQSRVAPGIAEYERPRVGERRLVGVRTIQTTETISAVGTVQPRRKSEIASRLLTTVQELTVNAGDQVSAGQLLVTLDDREIQAQLREAEAAVAGVVAELSVREGDYRRYKQMFAEKAVTKEEYDRMAGAFEVTQAQRTRAEQQVERIQIMLTYAAIKSPEAGIVSDRFVDPGDLAAPGKPLLAIHDPTELELHASVGENLAAHLRLGQSLGIRVDAAHLVTEGTVREIVPRAEAASRSVLVKVTLPRPAARSTVEDQLYIGMFGRLQIPVGQLDRIVVAAEAVQQIGQLNVVDVVADGDQLQRRYVRLGHQFGRDFEVLSGLRIGESVAIPAGIVHRDSSASIPNQRPLLTHND